MQDRPPRFVRSALFALAIVVVALAALPARADVSIPKAPERWVTDEAGMLSDGAKATLDARLEDYEKKSGHQVVVWIAQTIGGAPLDDFAVKTFQAWKIGRKGHDDGVLMIVLARDRAIDIEVGYGLEDRLTDARARRIIDEEMAPLLRAGKADAAVSSGVDAILASIEGKPVPAGSEAHPAPDATERLSPAKVALLVILFALFVILLATHPALAMYFVYSLFNGGGGFGGGGGGFGGGGGGFSGGGGRSGGGGARGGW